MYRLDVSRRYIDKIMRWRAVAQVSCEVLPAVRELGIGFVAYSPLGRGFLTAAVKSPDDYASDDMRRERDPRWRGENFAKNRAALTQLETLTADKGIALSSGDLRRIREAFPDGAYGPRYAEASLPAWV
jgi:hypothetical protein